MTLTIDSTITLNNDVKTPIGVGYTAYQKTPSAATGLLIIVAFVLARATSEILHLSFTCPVCKLDHSKTFFFIWGTSYFKCPLCGRGYVVEIRGDRCLFTSDPMDFLSSPSSSPLL